MNSQISLIAAMAKNRVIGRGNRLPWNLPEDLKQFREKTLGHPILMGRKTFQSIGKPLPKRTNIVITRDHTSVNASQGVLIASSLDEALQLAAEESVAGHEEIFVIGGAEIYRLALPRAHRLYLTLIDREYEGDAFFPEIDWAAYNVLSRDRRPGDPPFEFLTLERK